MDVESGFRIWSSSPWNWASAGLLLLALVLVARCRDPEAGLVTLLMAWQAAFLGAALNSISYCAQVAMDTGTVPIPLFLGDLRLRTALPCLPALALTAVILLIPRKASLLAPAWRRQWQVIVLVATAATLLFVTTLIGYILTGSLWS